MPALYPALKLPTDRRPRKAVSTGCVLSTSRIYTWRKALMEAGPAPSFIEAIVTPSSPIVEDTAIGSDAGISVDMPCGARVRISSGISPDLVTATLRALR